MKLFSGGQLTFAELVAGARQGPPKRRTSVRAEGSTPIHSPPPLETHPQTPPVDPHPGGDPEGPQKPKRRRADDVVCDGAVHHSAGVPDQPGKKKHGRGKSPRVMLDQLGAAYRDRFMEGPIDTAIDVLKAASKQLKRTQSEKDERFAELTAKRNKALDQAKRARDALEGSERKANMLKEALQKLKSAKEVSEAKMKEELQELKLAKEASEAKMREEFEKSVSTLKDEVEKLKKERDENEKALEEAKDWGDRVTRDAVEIVKDQFANALKQVQLRYSEVVVDTTVFDPSHVVLGNQIVKPTGRPDGTNLVIYQRP